MGGFLKGLMVGIVSFGGGFVVLSMVLPPEAVTPARLETSPSPAAAPESPEGGTETPPQPDPLNALPLADAPESPTVPAPQALPSENAGASAPIEEAGGATEPVEPDPTEQEARADEGSGQDALVPEAPPNADSALGLPSPPPASEDTVPTPVPGETTTLTLPSFGLPIPLEAPERMPASEADMPLAAAPASPDAPPRPAVPPAGAAAAPEEDTPDERTPDEGTPPRAQDEPPAVTPETADRAAPAILRAVPQSPGLNRTVEGVTTGRLPTIGAPAPALPAPDAAVDPDPALPAWQRHAAPFDPPGALPLFALVLIDHPAEAAAEAALLALPFAVSIALSPNDPDAPRRASAYRQAGHEILLLAEGLPARATPADLEVTFTAWQRALPEVVALLDPPEGGFQADRQLAQQLMPHLADDGLGLITQERGLNPAQQTARSAGVVSATVFRQIDRDDENQFTIRRYLDRATFRAQQEGRVIVLGHAGHPETIAGILGWRLEGRAGEVALAPVSALLTP